VLEVELDPEVTSAGFASLSKLPKLRHFLFGECTVHNVEVHLRCVPLCAQHLPKLQQIGSNCSHVSYGSIRDPKHTGTFYHNQILQQPHQLSIEKLLLSGDVTVHERCQLPELKELHLLCPTSSIVGHFTTNGRFSAIIHVGFYSSAVETTMEVLRIVGWRLRSLIIKEAPLHLSLLAILQSCPKLEKFELEDCLLSDSDDFWKQNLFSRLEEIHMNFYGTGPPPTGFIRMVNEYMITYKLNMIFCHGFIPM
jgi:hypothetical protein